MQAWKPFTSLHTLYKIETFYQAMRFGYNLQLITTLDRSLRMIWDMVSHHL